jgi:hypothetical protein
MNEMVELKSKHLDKQQEQQKEKYRQKTFKK